MSAQTQQVLSGQITDAVANALYGNASAKAFYHWKSVSDLQSFLGHQPYAVGGSSSQQKERKQAAVQQFPDLEKLFGSQSFCECEHCRSVYSPAAYLVDLLHLFLDDTTRAPTEKKPFGTPNFDLIVTVPPRIAELLKRRSDLVKIPLTCENTNTPLPYIDLVNEALESFIKAHLDGAGKWSDTPQPGDTIKAYDTGSTPADELRAVPQNVDADVYAHLANEAVYPMTLPFDRSLEIVRAYLAHLGTSRTEMMEVFQAPSASDPNTLLPTSHDIAIEALGLSPTQAAIIDGTLKKNVWEYYGYGSEADLLSLNNSPNKVPEFLKRTGLDLSDLLALFQTQFINPHVNEPSDAASAAAIRIQYPAFPDDACDITKMTFINLDPASGTDSHLNSNRIHRFLRLWRALGWPMADLDKAVIALDGELNPGTLEKLASIQQLALDLDSPITDLLVLWATIDTWGENSLYGKLFLSTAMISDVDAHTAFKNILDGTPLQPPYNEYKALADAIAAALAVTTADLERIRSYLGLTEKLIPDLKSLSILCRYGVLAKALGIRIRDLITLLSMAPADDTNPFAASDPRPAVKFVQLAQAVLDSGFSIPLINYLFRGEAEPTRHPAPTRELIENTFKELQKGLTAIWQETVVPEQPTAEDLRAALELAKNLLGEKEATGKVVTPLSPDEALAILDPRVSQFNGQPLALDDRTTFVSKHFTAFLSKPDQDILFDSSFTADSSEARFLKNVSTVLGGLLPWLRVKEQVLLTTQTMASAVGVDEKVADALLKGGVDAPIDNCTFAMDGTGDITVASAHGLSANEEVHFSTTGALPTELDVHTRYYVLSAGLTATKLRVSATVGGTVITYSAAGMGTHTIWKDNKYFLLHSTQNDPDADQRPALNDFLSLIDGNGNAVVFDVGDTLAAPVAPVATFVRMFKAAAYVTAFGMTEPELRLFASWQTPAHAQLDLNLFPLAIVDPSDQQPAKHFELWQELAKYYRLCEGLPKSERTLPDFFASVHSNVPADVRLATLVEAAGWEPTLVEALRTGFKIQITDLADLDRLSNFHRAVRLTKRLGANLKQTDDESKLEEPNVFDWAAAPPDGPQADAVVQMVKARYERTQWLDVARGLNDPMREKQRDAMVAFLIPRIKAANFDFKTPNDLLEYFLIDVEMSSCMLTSRIKQAISSVQLFIHRCLLNLEPAVSPAEIDVDWWEWMKNYRVWEANRKVFLYPENWIEPELRDDKTPFFKDLETELLQNEITKDTVEKALVNYLYKLDEVARLDIQGFCREVVQDASDSSGKQQEVYHVFGRTWNPPYVYYYRKGTFDLMVDGTGEWTPWEKLDLDIQGDHLIPVVYNRRLYLFWALFDERPAKNTATEKKRGPEKEHLKYLPAAGSVIIEGEPRLRWTGTSWEDMWKTKQEEMVVLKNTKDIKPDPAGNLVGWRFEGDGSMGHDDQWSWFEPGDELSEPPPTSWEVKIAWSEQANGQWSAKNISKEAFRSDATSQQVSTSDYRLVSVQAGENLLLDIYSRAGGQNSAMQAIAALFHFLDYQRSFQLSACQAALIMKDLKRGAATPIAPMLSLVNNQGFVRTTGGSLEFSKETVLHKTEMGYEFMPAPEMSTSIIAPFFFVDEPAGSRSYFARPVTVTLPPPAPDAIAIGQGQAPPLYGQQVGQPPEGMAYSKIDELAGGTLGQKAMTQGGTHA